MSCTACITTNLKCEADAHPAANERDRLCKLLHACLVPALNQYPESLRVGVIESFYSHEVAFPCRATTGIVFPHAYNLLTAGQHTILSAVHFEIPVVWPFRLDDVSVKVCICGMVQGRPASSNEFFVPFIGPWLAHLGAGRTVANDGDPSEIAHRTNVSSEDFLEIVHKALSQIDDVTIIE